MKNLNLNLTNQVIGQTDIGLANLEFTLVEPIKGSTNNWFDQIDIIDQANKIELEVGPIKNNKLVRPFSQNNFLKTRNIKIGRTDW